MKQIIFISLSLLYCLITSCIDRTQVKFVNQMEGKWTLAHEEIVLIQPDGTTVMESETENAGTLELSNPEESPMFLFYDLNIPGVYSRARDGLQIDEEGKRVLFLYFYCDDIFGCDLVCTIIENERNRQVWEFVRPRGNGVHRRVTWTFTKDN